MNSRMVGLLTSAALLLLPAAAGAQPDPIHAAESARLACLTETRGQLTATPYGIDRWTSIDRAVRFSWSVTMPANCRPLLDVTILPAVDRGPVLPRSGSRTIPVSRTTTFRLQAGRGSVRGVLAEARIQVAGEPPVPIRISDGPNITPEDLNAFNAQWMQPFDVNEALKRHCAWFRDRNDGGVWESTERSIAMVRMFEATHDRRYLEHLKVYADAARRYRDDKHYQPRIDQFRGFVAPGWGGAGVGTGNFHTVVEVVSGLYGYGLAAYTRLVAEDPALHAAFADSVVSYANALLSTAQLFLQQMRYRLGAQGREAFLSMLDIYDTMPTVGQCTAAYDSAMATGADPDRTKTQRDNCTNLRPQAGNTVSWNETNAIMMFLIELWRVLETDYYRQAPGRDPTAEAVRVQIPVVVSRYQRFFTRHLHTDDGAYTWHHTDGFPGHTRAEDATHSDLDLTYIDVLRRNYDRLNARAADWNEPIPPLELGKFVNTFLHKYAGSTNFAKNVDGESADDPGDAFNGYCVGWVGLTIASTDVFTRCREVTLRDVPQRGQPYLMLGTHAGLLMAKRLLPGMGDVFAPAANSAHVGNATWRDVPSPPSLQCPADPT